MDGLLFVTGLLVGLIIGALGMCIAAYRLGKK